MAWACPKQSLSFFTLLCLQLSVLVQDFCFDWLFSFLFLSFLVAHVLLAVFRPDIMEIFTFLIFLTLRFIKALLHMNLPKEFKQLLLTALVQFCSLRPKILNTNLTLPSTFPFHYETFTAWISLSYMQTLETKSPTISSWGGPGSEKYKPWAAGVQPYLFLTHSAVLASKMLVQLSTETLRQQPASRNQPCFCV